MNEQLEQALATLIEKSMTGLDATVDFLSAEVPDVVQQLLVWYGVKSAIIGLVGIIILFACGLCIKKICTKPEEGVSNMFWMWSGYRGRHETPPEVVFSALLLFPFFLGATLSADLMTALQIWIAPKIWLLEYASNFVK